LIFDGGNSTLLPPIHHGGQVLPNAKSVASTLPGRDLLLGAQEHGPILLVGEIREPVQPKAELFVPRPIVVLLNEPQIILKNLEPSLLLPNGVVGLGVLHQPRLVGFPQEGVVVVDDGHVEGEGAEGKREKNEHDEKCMVGKGMRASN